MKCSEETSLHPRVLIIHEVASYVPWKAVFDGAEKMRKDAGEISYCVMQDAANPNLVVHLSSWTSHEAARQFFESPKLVQIRKDAGVAAPHFLYLNEVEAGVL